METGQLEAELRGHSKDVQCVAWSPDGKFVATGSYDHSIRLWDTDGTALRSFDGLKRSIQSLAISVDSRELLFTQGEDGDGGFSVSILDLMTGQERNKFRPAYKYIA